MRFITFIKKGKPNSNKLGNKASNLIKMFKAGIEIPDGFIVKTSSYKYFLKKAQLKQKLTQTFSKEYLARDVIELSKKVKSQILESELPKRISSNVKQAYNKMVSKFGKKISFAVRSSSRYEDLKEFSFAGQAESFLNKEFIDDILNSIKNCWASMFSPQNLLYLLQLRRKGCKITPIELEMAVLVQKMVEAQASGVLFTANVLNNNFEQILINSTWGLGEAITNSSITPDSIILNKGEFEILKKDIGNKVKMSIPDHVTHSTILVYTDKELREKCSLTNTQLEQLHKLAVKIENLFNYPQDIEWAFEEDMLYTLQSRPITTLK